MPHLRSQRARREGDGCCARLGRPESGSGHLLSLSLSSRDGLGDLYIFGDIKGGPATYKTLASVPPLHNIYSLPDIVFSGSENHHTSTKLAHTILDDGHLRHGLRGALSLPFSFAPEQAIRRIQLPRVRKEKDGGCFQGGQDRERRAQSAGVDAEGS